MTSLGDDMKPITLREREVQRLKATGELLVVREVRPQPEQREGGITPILFDVSGWEFMDIEGGGQPVKCPLGKPGDRLWAREVKSHDNGRDKLTRLQEYPDGSLRAVFGIHDEPNAYSRKCPIGKPGDRMWVRGVWYAERTHTRLAVDYRADGDEHYNWYDRGFKWLSPVVMPKEASRFTVETVAVECKRALEITWAELESAGRSGNIAEVEERWRNTGNNAANPWCWFALVKEVK